MTHPITVFVAREIVTMNPSNPTGTHGVDQQRHVIEAWRGRHRRPFVAAPSGG